MSTLKVDTINTSDGSGNITLSRPTILQAGDIVTADLANDAVTSVKIVDDAVTIAKLAATGTASSSTFLRGDNAWAAAGGGKMVQQVNVQVEAVATSTNVFLHPTTIPVKTDGFEVMTLAITPTNTNNILQISANVIMSIRSGASWFKVGLFQDTTTNAIATTYAYQSVSTGTLVMPLDFRMVAGTTSSTTFKIRIGGPDSNTTTFNGDGETRRDGGVAYSSITITEIEV